MSDIVNELTMIIESIRLDNERLQAEDECLQVELNVARDAQARAEYLEVMAEVRLREIGQLSMTI